MGTSEKLTRCPMPAVLRGFIVVALCGFVFAQSAPLSQQPPISAPALPTAATFSAGVYTNQYFRFTYRLPQQWTEQQSASPFAANSDYREQAPAIGHENDGKKYLLISAGEPGTDDSVQVVAYDVSDEPTITGNDVAVAELGALRSLGGKMEGISDRAIGGRTVTVGRAEMTGDVQGQSQPVYAGVAAVKEGNFVLTWSFFANSDTRLKQLLGTLDSISFEK